MQNVTCYNKPYNRTVQLINMDFELSNGIILYNANVNIQVFYKYNTYQPFLINVNENLCDLLSGSVTSKIFIMQMENIMKSGTINHPCPYNVRTFTKK